MLVTLLKIRISQLLQSPYSLRLFSFLFYCRLFCLKTHRYRKLFLLVLQSTLLNEGFLNYRDVFRHFLASICQAGLLISQYYSLQMFLT